MSSKPDQGTEYHYEKVSVNDNEKESDIPEKEVIPHGFGVRHFQCLIIFICMSVIFIVRAHLGVTIVAMVDDSVLLKNMEDTNITNFTNYTEYSNATLEKYDDEVNSTKTYSEASNITKNSNNEQTDNSWNVYRQYKWTKPIQDMVLSSFFLGYFLMMFPMGLVVQRWGGKLPLQIALSITGVTSLMTPWLAVWGGWKAVCASRIAQGLCQAGVYPSTLALLACWSPISERSRLTTYVFTGTMVGTVIAFQVGGVLAASSWGWPSSFWTTGILSLLAFALLTVFVSATPHVHKSISEEEKRFILAGAQSTKSTQKSRTPWGDILKSKEIWSLFCTHVGNGTTFFFFLTQVSSYLHYIFGVDVKKSGLLSSLPYIGNFLASLVFGAISDFSINRKIVTTRTARIINNSVASTGIAICLAAVSYTSSTTLGVICLVLGLVCLAGMHTGFMVNYIDVAPNYSGILMATGNALMNVGVLIMPMLVSNIVTDVTNPYQWRIVLSIVAGLSFLTNLVFVIFMTADVLPWNDSEKVNEYPSKEMCFLNGKDITNCKEIMNDEKTYEKC